MRSVRSLLCILLQTEKGKDFNSSGTAINDYKSILLAFKNWTLSRQKFKIIVSYP